MIELFIYSFQLEGHVLEEGEYDYDEYMQWDGEAEEEVWHIRLISRLIIDLNNVFKVVEQPSNEHVLIGQPPEVGSFNLVFKSCKSKSIQGGQFAEDEYGEFVAFENHEDARKYV